MNDIDCFISSDSNGPSSTKGKPSLLTAHTLTANDGPQIIAQQIESQGIPNPWTTGHWFLGKLHDCLHLLNATIE